MVSAASEPSLDHTHSHVGILIANPQGITLEINNRACEILGISGEEFLSRHLEEVIPSGPGDLAIGVLPVGESILLERQLVTGGGRYLQVAIYIERLPSGNYLGIIREPSAGAAVVASALEASQPSLEEAPAAPVDRMVSLEEVLDILLDSARRIVRHDASVILLIEEGLARIVRLWGADVEKIAGWEERIHLMVAGTPDLHRMAETKTHVLVPDTLRDTGWIRFAETDWVRTCLSAPINVHGETIGFICLYGDRPGIFQADHAERLQGLADQAGVAIQDARVLEATRQAHQTAEGLLVASMAISRTLETDDVLQALLIYLEQMVSYDSATIGLLDGDRLVIRARRGYEHWKDDGTIRSINLDNDASPILSGVVRTQQSMVLDDTFEYPGWPPIAGLDHVRNWMAVPLSVRGKVIGLCALDKNIPGYFTREHLMLVESLGAQAAVAIQNARLYTAERRKRQAAESLREATAGLRSALNLNQVLGDILVSLERVVPYHRARIHLQEEDGLHMVADRGVLAGDPDAGSIPSQESPLFSELRRRKAPIYLSDAGAEAGDSMPEWLEQVRSWMGVPLIVRGDLIGYLTLESDQPSAYDQAAASLTQAYADQAAVAIENARLFEQVHSGRERLKALSRRLVEVQEMERRSIARELHDQVGQLLTGLKLVLDLGSRHPDGMADDNLAEAQELVNELMKRVRELSLDLRPAMLDDLGLLPALLWLFERYTHQTRVTVDIRHMGVEDRRFAPEIETAAYRIIQEALTNIARYAGVEGAAVRLWTDEKMLCLQIEDRGSGFDPQRVLSLGGNSGISGMRERAILVGGQLTLESSPGKGTLVTAELPLGGYLERRKRER